MYRMYENPYTLEQRIQEVEGLIKNYPQDIDLQVELQELRDRLNFAWQDDEEG